MTLDDEGIGRILAEVGQPFVPEQVDRISLRLDIEHVWDSYRGYDRESGKGLRSKRHKLVLKISKCADELLHLLDDPKDAEWVRKRLGQAFPICEGSPVTETIWDTDPNGLPINFRRVADPLRQHDESSFPGLKAGLVNLSDVAARVARSQTGQSSMREVLQITPLMWLVGHDLAAIYEAHFLRKAGRGRSPKGGEPGGPFVRFTIAVVREFGETISSDAVEAALKEVRSLRRRNVL